MKEIYEVAPHWRQITESKTAQYKSFSKDLSNLSIIIHNASWCPDCEREVTDLLAFLSTQKNKPHKVEIHNYEDKELYKKMKSEKNLSISCLPTIIFNDKNSNSIATIEEQAIPNFTEFIKANL
jgi:thiol-disulfide isomerase/thioredoxin